MTDFLLPSIFLEIKTILQYVNIYPHIALLP